MVPYLDIPNNIEAKRFGIKTGMTVRDARLLYPSVIVRTPDPAKYRYVHLKFRKIFQDYSRTRPLKASVPTSTFPLPWSQKGNVNRPYPLLTAQIMNSLSSLSETASAGQRFTFNAVIAG